MLRSQLQPTSPRSVWKERVEFEATAIAVLQAQTSTTVIAKQASLARVGIAANAIALGCTRHAGPAQNACD